MQAEIKKKIVRRLLEKNILVSSEMVEELDRLTPDELRQRLEIINASEEPQLAYKEGIMQGEAVTKSQEPERNAAIDKQTGQQQIRPPNVKIVRSYSEPTKKYEPADFVSYFNARFRELERILRNRQELSQVTSIARIISKTERENVALIGIVKEKVNTQTGKIILMVEDLSGEIRVIVDPSKQEVFAQAKSVVNDEVIGITGSSGNRMVFANGIICPDVPLTKHVKKAQEEGYAAFLSDLHVGSKKFLKDEFEKFLRWVNDPTGKHAHMVQNLKYIFIVGDLVDGVGIYPGQESELEIKDIYAQYAECARLLGQIPKHIQIIVCAGNHDAIRLSEPQPELPVEFAKPLYELSNLIAVSNPAVVNVHSSNGFPGFDILLYHGYSFDYYIQNVDEIRNSGGYDRADLVMKFLLQRRHLSPSHTATLYVPDQKRDPLLIDIVPDFFVTGHIHKTAVANYRNISLICGSCWQAKTDFQERVGHHPEPARVPIVNLQTRETKILRF